MMDLRTPEKRPHVIGFTPKNVRTTCFWLYIVCSPLNVFSFTSNWSIMKYLSLGIGILYLFSMRGDFHFSFNKAKKKWILYFVYAAITLLWANNITKGSQNVVSLLETTAFAMLLINDTYDEYDIRKIENGFIIAGFIMAAFVFVMGIADTADRIVIRGTNTLADGNEINAFFIMPIIIAMKRLSGGDGNRKSEIIIPVVTLILSIYIDLLTGSRSGIIGLAAGLLFATFMFFKFDIKKFILFFALAVSVYMVFTRMIIPLLPQEMLQRYTLAAITEDKGSLRLDIWKTMWDYITESPGTFLFGYGRGGLETYTRACHNQLLQEMLYGGLVGVVIYINLIISLIKNALKNCRTAAVGVIATQFMLLFLTLNASFKSIWIIWMYALVEIVSTENEMYGERI